MPFVKSQKKETYPSILMNLFVLERYMLPKAGKFEVNSYIQVSVSISMIFILEPKA